MKILHILNEFREIGNGIVNVAVDLACTQSLNGHQVVVASSGGEYQKLLEKSGGRHVLLNQERSFFNLIRSASHYRKLIKEFKPDIVHAHMMTGTVLAKLFKGSGNYSLITTVHNEYQKSAILMGYGDKVVAVSEAVRKAMQDRGVKADKLRVVRNGTIGSPRRVAFKDIQPAQLQHPAIITLGAVSPRKGSFELIKAFIELAAEFTEAHVYFIGNKDWPEIEKIALESAFKDRIHFEGFQSQPQKYLLGADIFVLPSHKDPFPLVMMEAREAGLPIIASDVDGIPEAVNFGEAGILVPPQNIDALAAALRSLLSNADKCAELSAKSREGLEYYSVKRMNDDYEKIYQEQRLA